MKNIKDFASKPQLIEIVLDDADIIKAYDEPITFYTYDILSLSTYFEFYNARSTSEFKSLEKILRTLILDDKGSPVIGEGQDLPFDIAVAAMTKLGENMGKSQRKTSTQVVGEPQK
jgi:hypothetical protein